MNRISSPRHEASDSGTSILRPGETCWRVANATRARVLVDGAEYFGILRQCLLEARHQVLIAGWDVDGRAEIRGPDATRDGAPKRLRRLLRHIGSRRPGLDIRILLWDFADLYMLGREVAPTINLGWRMAGTATICLDDMVPPGGCHHQKIVVIDDRIAFCGGIDLTRGRWDTPAHDPDNPVFRHGQPDLGRPFHDLQMMVEGEAAAALGDLVRARWRRATREEVPTVAGPGLAWPKSVAPMFEDLRVGIARTMPALAEGESAVREIEESYLAAITVAEQLIYIENQYMTSHRICEAIAARMRERPELEVVLIGPREAIAWLEEAAMGAARGAFVGRLRSEFGDRVSLFYPYVRNRRGTDVPVKVHSKVLIVDDRVLRIGSSNLNNRSMGFDTECDLVVDARTPAEREAIAGIRDRLIAEHLGLAASGLPEAVARYGGFLPAIRAHHGEGRGVRVADIAPSSLSPEILAPIQMTLDPEATGDLHHLFRSPQPEEIDFSRDDRPGWKLLAGALAATLALLAVAWAVWGRGPFQLDANSALGILERAEELPWTPALVIGLYLIACTIGIPVTLLVAATAVVFGPFAGFVYALAGSVGSAVLGFLIGRRLGGGLLRRFSRGRIQRISNGLQKQGFLSVAVVRMVPIAPFVVVNLVAGAMRLRLADFTIGTAAGMLPGIAVLSSVGSSIAGLLSEPSPSNIAFLVLAIAAWIGLVFGLRYLIRRLRR